MKPKKLVEIRINNIIPFSNFRKFLGKCHKFHTGGYGKIKLLAKLLKYLQKILRYRSRCVELKTNVFRIPDQDFRNTVQFQIKIFEISQKLIYFILAILKKY